MLEWSNCYFHYVAIRFPNGHQTLAAWLGACRSASTIGFRRTRIAINYLEAKLAEIGRTVRNLETRVVQDCAVNVLALEPFYGGSHRAFLDGWQRHSSHRMTVRGFPAYKWKWRMRHAAVTLAEQLGHTAPEEYDVLWVSDMLNLAEFIGLAPKSLAALPRVAYFHENQLTYPVREPRDRDLHFAFTNLSTSLCADEVWFNTEFHRQDFLGALDRFIARMPDHAPRSSTSMIEKKSRVLGPGVEPIAQTGPRATGPLRIGWNARWEFDKNPDDFFAALRVLKQRKCDFELVVLGESYQTTPPIFGEAHTEFSEYIQHWGYASSSSEYRDLLSTMDVVVSTANHEFFGIGVVEAMAAGAIPVLPNRLAYPEVLATTGSSAELHLYDGSIRQLADRLAQFAQSTDQLDTLRRSVITSVEPFHWRCRAKALDEGVERVAARSVPEN